MSKEGRRRRQDLKVSLEKPAKMEKTAKTVILVKMEFPVLKDPSATLEQMVFQVKTVNQEGPVSMVLPVNADLLVTQEKLDDQEKLASLVLLVIKVDLVRKERLVLQAKLVILEQPVKLERPVNPEWESLEKLVEKEILVVLVETVSPVFPEKLYRKEVEDQWALKVSLV